MDFPKTVLLVGLALMLVSCARADVVPDLPTLRRQIDRSDPEIVTALTGSGEARSRLLRLHPGALFYLAASLAGRGQYADARVLFQEQMGQADSDWQLPAFRGWLDCALRLKDWPAVSGQAVAAFAALPRPAGQGPGEVSRLQEWRLAADGLCRARIEAGFQAGDLIEVRGALAAAAELYPVEGSPVAAIGESARPAWLLYQSARLAMREGRPPVTAADGGFVRSILGYLLGQDAREGHGDLAWWLAGGDGSTGGKPPMPDRDLRTALALARAKELLARSEPVAAWEIMRGFVAWPGMKKAARAQAAAAQASLIRLHRLAGLAPLMFLRDLYNAARLSGRLSDGIEALDVLRPVLAKAEPGWRDGATLPYLLELRGRLAKARDDGPRARASFTEAWELARSAEAGGRLARTDRQRIQWSCLDSLLGGADEIHGPLFDLDAVLAIARSCDDPEYFGDVMEEAVLRLGNRADWPGLERWDHELAERMPAPLRQRCALLLARSAQLAHPDNLAGDSRFQTMSARLAGQTDSLYYAMLGRWMRGEPIAIDAMLASQAAAGQYQGAGGTAAAGSPNWAQTIAEGYCAMAMYDQGMEFIWSHRNDLSLAGFVRLGRQYVEAGRFRQGLRILDSARVRFGHPADPSLLAAFYPRPFQEAMTAATGNTVVPEWLMYALVRTESNFDVGAQSGPGARGLSQLMPATARLVASGLGIENPDLMEPAVNLRIGARYLADQWQGQGRWPQALAAYNAGSGRVRAWTRAGLSADPILFAELVPFAETRNYIRRITEGAVIYGRLYYGQEADAVLSILYTPAATYRQ